MNVKYEIMKRLGRDIPPEPKNVEIIYMGPKMIRSVADEDIEAGDAVMMRSSSTIIRSHPKKTLPVIGVALSSARTGEWIEVGVRP